MSGCEAKENEARRTVLDRHPAVTSAMPLLIKGNAFRERSRHVMTEGMLLMTRFNTADPGEVIPPLILKSRTK